MEGLGVLEIIAEGLVVILSDVSCQDIEGCLSGNRGHVDVAPHPLESGWRDPFFCLAFYVGSQSVEICGSLDGLAVFPLHKRHQVIHLRYLFTSHIRSFIPLTNLTFIVRIYKFRPKDKLFPKNTNFAPG